MIENKFKRLAIISDCIHLQTDDGNYATENHIYCKQIQSLCSYFESTVICCPFIKYNQSKVISVYTNQSIRFIPLPNVGGSSLKHKLQLFKTIPTWLKAFAKADKESDIVYLRLPNNLSIPGFFYFWLKRKKRFGTYTGTWKNYKGEPSTYRFQKSVIKKLFNAPVWVYVDEVLQQKNLHKGYSPSYSLKEWDEETAQVSKRIEKLSSNALDQPIFISVGALTKYKNQQLLLNVFKKLQDGRFSFKLWIAGDGPLKEEYESFIIKNNLQQSIKLLGKLTADELRTFYRRANFVIQPSISEGYGKVPIEGFFHGLIPILSNVPMAKEMTGNGSRGFTFDVMNEDELYELIMTKISKSVLNKMIESGREYARYHTLENWSAEYVKTTNEFYCNG